MLDEKLLKKIIFKEKWVNPRDFKLAEKEAEKRGKPIEQHLVDEHLVDEEELYEKASKTMGVPYIPLKGREIKSDVQQLIPVSMASHYGVIAFAKGGGVVRLAMLNPNDIVTKSFIEKKTGASVKIFLTSPGGFKDVLRRYHSQIAEKETFGTFTILQEKTEADGKTGEDLKKAAQDLPIVNIVNSILERAVYADASDIHIEPEEKDVVVRFRIDGILHPEMTFPKNVESGMVARVKILAKLKLDEHMLPQDGRFKMRIADDQLSFRVSITPTMSGEKIVMRLLHEGTKPLTLDELGLLPGAKEIVERNIRKPHGMILVTGPTGSGKTTTLYSILNILNEPTVNIITIEDPIEYRIKGINQSQVNPKVGFEFANALRSFLRQDPDIIMVGEIRDEETAVISIHAAMTGHLVLSTLHTNDAPTTLPRITEMGVPPYLLAFTANMIVAQRLVRKICEFCKKEVRLDAKTLEDMEKTVKIERLLSNMKKLKLIKGKENLKSMTFYRGEGCRKCGNSGYKGRIGIYETLEVGQEIQKLINEHGTANEIRTLAVSKGMVTMIEDGFLKAKMGITSLEEIFRVTKE